VEAPPFRGEHRKTRWLVFGGMSSRIKGDSSFRRQRSAACFIPPLRSCCYSYTAIGTNSATYPSPRRCWNAPLWRETVQMVIWYYSIKFYTLIDIQLYMRYVYYYVGIYMNSVTFIILFYLLLYNLFCIYFVFILGVQSFSAVCKRRRH